MEPGRVSSNSRKAQVGTAVMSNMVQELEPDGGIPYQCHILDRLYDPYEQDPTSDLAEPVTASVPEEVHAQPQQEHEACSCRVLHELYINNIAVHFAAGKKKRY